MNNRYFSHLLIFLISFILQTISHSQQQTISFQNYTTRNGLSANKINTVLQDKLGFLWFATEDGLNRFDGYEFKIYRNDPNDSLSITSNDIWSLLEDYDGNIWIGTKTGELNRYNFKTDNFTSWNIDPNEAEENGITCIFRDRDKNLWIGTYRNGLYLFNPFNNSFKNWNYNYKDKNSLSNNFITGIIQDYLGNLWISTYNGLNKFNPRISDKSFTKFYYQQDNTESIHDNLIWSLSHSEFFNNEIWICTANGLSQINVNDNSIYRITLPAEKNLPFGNSISSVYEDVLDDEKVLWLGSYGGLIKYNLQTQKTERYLSNETQAGQLVSNQINEIFKDRSGVFWIITENGIGRWSSKTAKFNPLYVSGQNFEALSRLNKKNINAFQKSDDGRIWIGTSEGLYVVTYLNNYAVIKKQPELDGKNIWALKLGSANSLWIGTYGQGLFRFDLSTSKAYPVEIKSPTFETNAYKYVRSILEDEENNLWVGFWGGGLCRLKNGNYEIWINENKNKSSLSHNDVWSIHQDKSGRVWIGTNGGGLNLVENSGTIKFFRLVRSSETDKALSSNVIYSIVESSQINSDSETVLWIGTSSGLNKLTVSNSYTDYQELLSNIKIQHYTTRDGLPDNIIKAVVEDSYGNLWISSNSGLSKFNLETNTFFNYNSIDGIKNIEFNSGAVIQLNNGLMLFGGTGGVDFFYEQSIVQSDFIPPIVFTDFLIFNKKVNIGTDTPLPVNISAAEKIILPYSQNVFSFQFAALDYNSPNSIEYAYMMEGFDNDWIRSKNNRTATYTNLNPGKYTFKVKATNSDGFWVEVPASISLTIDSPWWRTYWAYAAYVLIIIAGLYLIRKTELNRSRLRNELKVRELEAEKLKEIEKIKSRFFANLSHEFRTPLMLIKGPAEQLINLKGNNGEEQARLIQRNAEKLQNLIDQLLELSQLEAGSLSLKAKKDNLIVFAKGIFSSFESLAKQRNITLEFNSTSKKVFVWFDNDKFEKILNNLLSNAFKFTEDGGRISLSIIEHKSENEHYISLMLKDSGIGIPGDKLNKVFDRFYQVDDSSKRAYGGSGIGLALVKELVDIHNWKINVESEVGQWTQFTINIPAGDLHLNENQRVADESVDTEAELSAGITNMNLSGATGEVKRTNRDNNKVQKEENLNSTVLVVEDSEDVRFYLSDLLKPYYNILLAENGEKGLYVALEKLPDLIISDVMMPEMDGMEFCKRIKSDWKTSHIPVILLTAKASFESKMEGLETGADEYITKPFSFRELSARIKNLLEQRIKLQQKFGNDTKLKPENITPNKSDQEFLLKAISIVEKNISNAEFDSDKFAEEIFLSRSQLHRKLLSITGQSTGEFIRTIRLKKAAGLILEKQLSVTQIAFEVGFNSPSHFTKAFKQMFNCLPSDFVNSSNS